MTLLAEAVAPDDGPPRPGEFGLELRLPWPLPPAARELERPPLAASAAAAEVVSHWDCVGVQSSRMWVSWDGVLELLLFVALVVLEVN